MPADALFTLAMACNVYLTFFKQYDARTLRKLEWRYLVLCYGLPFIPAVVYMGIETKGQGKIYGSANVWRPSFLLVEQFPLTLLAVVLGITRMECFSHRNLLCSHLDHHLFRYFRLRQSWIRRL